MQHFPLFHSMSGITFPCILYKKKLFHTRNNFILPWFTIIFNISYLLLLLQYQTQTKKMRSCRKGFSIEDRMKLIIKNASKGNWRQFDQIKTSLLILFNALYTKIKLSRFNVCVHGGCEKSSLRI